MNAPRFLAADPRTQAITRSDFHADPHVIEHRELGKDFGDLERACNAERNALVRRQRRDVAAIEGHRSAGRLKKPADEIEERGLARPVWADDRAQLAGLDVKRNVLQRDEIAEALADIHDVEHAHVSPLRRSTPRRPRGKNNTIPMNSMPTNDIQFTVMLDR